MIAPVPAQSADSPLARLLLASVLSLLGSMPALAADAGTNAASPRPSVLVNSQPTALPASLHQVHETGQMTLRVREGNLLQLPRAAAKVMVANPTIANFQMPSPTSVFVFAQSAGSTTLYALDARDQVIAAIRIVAEYNLQELRDQIGRSVPGALVELEPTLNGRMIVRGKVRTPIEARQVVDHIQAYLDSTASGSGSGGSGGGGGGGGGQQGGAGNGGGGDPRSSAGRVINQLQVELSSQINIQVRVVEVSRSLSHELGFDWGTVLSSGGGSFAFGTGNASNLFDAVSAGTASSLLPASTAGGLTLGGFRTRGRFTLGGLISALSGEGMATLLAEPNLTAMSGESAAFAAGGEVPVVIITNNNTTIDYKSYGVILRMTPTLLSPNRISLHIAPEVSELTDEGSVTLDSGSTIPALKVRRADTTVELASGQSFALAGMLRSTVSQQIEGVPGLSSIPWLGRLFEHEVSEKEDTELVILVTANVVDPVGAGELQVPGQGLPVIDEFQPRQAAAGYLY